MVEETYPLEERENDRFREIDEKQKASGNWLQEDEEEEEEEEEMKGEGKSKKAADGDELYRKLF